MPSGTSLGAEILAGALVANGEVLEDRGEEGRRLVQGGLAPVVLGERCSRRCANLVLVTHFQVVEVLEVAGSGEVDNLCKIKLDTDKIKQ